MNKYVKKIRNTLIMFLAIIIVSIIACVFVGCGEKKNDTKESEQLNVCYGEVIRYDVYCGQYTLHREIVIKTQNNQKKYFNIINNKEPNIANYKELEDILVSKTGDFVSVTYNNDNKIVKYNIVKD